MHCFSLYVLYHLALAPRPEPHWCGADRYLSTRQRVSMLTQANQMQFCVCCHISYNITSVRSSLAHHSIAFAYAIHLNTAYHTPIKGIRRVGNYVHFVRCSDPHAWHRVNESSCDQVERCFITEQQE